MKRNRFFASVAAATLGFIGMSAVAGATPTSTHTQGAHAAQIGVVQIDPTNPQVAYVTGNYSCPAGPAHLFVSVKQVADGHPDNRLKLEGSSAISSGWLERHPAPSEFTCDGTMHTGTWRITSNPADPGYEYGHGALIPGQVYVQFCWDSLDGSWHAYSEQFARAA